MVVPVRVNSADGPLAMWSPEANVGLNAPNKQADVELVQLGYAFRLTNPKAPKTAEEIAVYKTIKLGAVCTGRADDPLVRSIIAHQKARGGVQDGHVSPFSESHAAYKTGDGQHNMMGVSLVFSIMDSLPEVYPRLDKSTNPPCPAVLKAAIRKMCSF